MKRIIAFLLVMSMCISALGVTVFAAETAALSVEEKSATRGENITLVVTLTQNPGIAGMQFEISYDETRLEKVEYETVDFDGGNWTNINCPVWDNAGDSTATGDLLKLTFKVKDDAPTGNAFVNVSCVAGNWDGNRISIDTAKGGVNISESSHEHKFASKVSDATCTAGSVWKCSCGASTTQNGALGHDMKIQTQATCDMNGSKKCSRCNRIETISATGKHVDKNQDGSCDSCGYGMQSSQGCVHQYVEVENVVPSCEEAGYTVYKCANCGNEYTDTSRDALGHEIEYMNNEDDQTHTKYCVRNGCALEVKENHEYYDGYCICGAEGLSSSVDAPADNDDLDEVPQIDYVQTDDLQRDELQPDDAVPAIIWGLVAMLAMLGAASVLLLIVLKRNNAKRKKAKYRRVR